MSFFKEISDYGRFVRSISSTFVVMIQRKGELKILRTLDQLAWSEACINGWQIGSKGCW